MENFKFYRPIVVGGLGKPIGSVEDGLLKIKGVKEKIKLVKKELLKDLDGNLKNEGWVEEGYKLCNLYFESEERKTSFKNVLVKENEEKIGENFLENIMDLSDIFNKKIKKVVDVASYWFKFFVLYKEEEVVIILSASSNVFVKKFKNNTSIKNKNYTFYNFETYKKAKQIYIKDDKIYFDGKENKMVEEVTNNPVHVNETLEGFINLISDSSKCDINEVILNYKIDEKNFRYIKITKDALIGYEGSYYDTDGKESTLIECENVFPEGFNQVVLLSYYLKLLTLYQKTNNWHLVTTKKSQNILIHSDEKNKEYHIVLSCEE